MKSQSVIDLGHERGRQLTESGSETLEIHRSHLLGLRLRCKAKPGPDRWDQNLEWEDTGRTAR